MPRKVRLAFLALLALCVPIAPAPRVAATAQTFSKALNNASSVLATAYASGSGTLTVADGTGGRFGSPTADVPIRITVTSRASLVNGTIAPTSVRSVFNCTGRTGDVLTGLTLAPGEDTPAWTNADRNYAANDLVAALITAGMIGEIQAAATPSTSSQVLAPQPQINCRGDSITVAGSPTYPQQLATLSGRSVRNNGVGGARSDEILAFFLADLVGTRSFPTIIEAGRNDVLQGVTNNATIVANIKAMTDALIAAGNTQFFVLPIFKGELTSTESGLDTPTTWAQIDALNATLRTNYGVKFVDVYAPLVAGSPTLAQDILDQAAGISWTSRRQDWLHPNTAGAAIMAQTVYAAMLAQWSPPNTLVGVRGIPGALQNLIPTILGNTVPGVILCSDPTTGQLAQAQTTTFGNAYVPQATWTGTHLRSNAAFLLDSTDLALGNGRAAFTLDATAAWTPFNLTIATNDNLSGRPPSQFFAISDNFSNGHGRDDLTRSYYQAITGYSHNYNAGTGHYEKKTRLGVSSNETGTDMVTALASTYDETAVTQTLVFEGSTVIFSDEAHAGHMQLTWDQGSGTLNYQLINGSAVMTVNSDGTTDRVTFGRIGKSNFLNVNGAIVQQAAGVNTYTTSIDGGLNHAFTGKYGPLHYFVDNTGAPYASYFVQLQVGTIFGPPIAWLHVQAQDTTLPAAVLQPFTASTQDLLQFRAVNGTTVNGRFRVDASWAPPHLANASAANDSVYYSTDAGAVGYKDGAGTFHAFY